MRLLPALLLATAVLTPCACASKEAGTSLPDGGDDADYGVTDQVEDDASGINTCLMYGPAGAACKTGGVCGAGETNDTDFLCLSSIEICCVPTKALDIDAGAEPLPDGGVVILMDAGKDSGKPNPHDGGHDAGDDAGHATSHDAGVDAPKVKPHDSGTAHDATTKG